MHDPASSLIGAWANFYVITGSSAGALTGLMFVVITLVAGTPTRTRDEGIATFSTPTVVHFGAALFVSAMLSAPWPALIYIAVLLGVTGICGVAYVARVMVRARRLTIYNPETEDWIWYTILPVAAYLTILAAGVVLPWFPTPMLFALAGATVLLVFIGIHNAWDVVTFIATGQAEELAGRTDANRATTRGETTGEG
jgi:hypothetical protein